MNKTMLKFEELAGVHQISPAVWDALATHDNPFVEHAFLAGLEISGCVGPRASGWVPRPLAAYVDGRLMGAALLYDKHDSFGEYIFDWNWAEVAMQAGIPYYPKTVSAVPFTPVTGPRLLLHAEAPANLRHELVRAVLERARTTHSLHVLFCEADELTAFATAGMLRRLTFQYHWQADPSWRSFDDFLTALRAPSRKQVRKERRTARAHGLQLSMRRGTHLTNGDWEALYAFYCQTTRAKHAARYLQPAFFGHLRNHMASCVVAAMAHRDGTPIAGALFLTRGRNLFGRYWGCTEDYDALHFELCYYMPIAWALEHGITRFEAGAQGDHKLKRGLLARPCYSAHKIAHTELHRAVERYLQAEAANTAISVDASNEQSPYRRDTT